MKSLTLLTLVLLFIFTWLGVVAAEETRTVKGSYWYIVDHIRPSDRDATGTIWVVLPAERPGQKVEITGIHPKPAAIITDTDKVNRLIVWEVEPQPGASALLMHFDFTAQISAVLNEVDAQNIQPYDTQSPEYQRFTQAEFGIENDQEIQDLSQAIVGDETNPYFQAKLIYDWILANFEFVPGGYGDYSAKAVSRSRRGDCTQYGLLFSALGRALGIPARTVSCEWLTGGQHILAEFFLPPYGWIPVDPSVGQLLMPNFQALPEQEIQKFIQTRGIPVQDPEWLFGNLYRNRLITSVGNNNEIVSADDGSKRVYAFLNTGGMSAEPPAYEFEGFNRDIVHGGFYHFGDQVLDEESAHDLAHHKLSAYYFDAGLYDLVETSCLKTLEVDPDGVTAWSNLGRVYLRKGEYTKAEASFKRALTSQETLSEDKMTSLIWVHNYLGNTYDLMGKRNLALAEYTRVVEMNVNYLGAVAYARRYLNSPFKQTDL